jgi:hypothetical protein
MAYKSIFGEEEETEEESPQPTSSGYVSIFDPSAKTAVLPESQNPTREEAIAAGAIPAEQAEYFPGTAGESRSQAFGRSMLSTGRNVVRAAEMVNEFASMVPFGGMTTKHDPETFSKMAEPLRSEALETEIYDRSTMDEFIEGVIEGIPQLGGAMAAGAVGGPVAGLAFATAQETGSQYEQALEAGATRGERLVSAGAGGSLAGALEAFGASKILSAIKGPKKVLGRWFADIFKNAAIEGPTEGAQGIVSRTMEALTYAGERGISADEIPYIFDPKTLAMEVGIGTVLGGGVTGVGQGVQMPRLARQEREAFEAAKQDVELFGDHPSLDVTSVDVSEQVEIQFLRDSRDDLERRYVEALQSEDPQLQAAAPQIERQLNILESELALRDTGTAITQFKDGVPHLVETPQGDAVPEEAQVYASAPVYHRMVVEHNGRPHEVTVAFPTDTMEPAFQDIAGADLSPYFPKTTMAKIDSLPEDRKLFAKFLAQPAVKAAEKGLPWEQFSERRADVDRFLDGKMEEAFANWKLENNIQVLSPSPQTLDEVYLPQVVERIEETRQLDENETWWDRTKATMVERWRSPVREHRFLVHGEKNVNLRNFFRQHQHTTNVKISEAQRRSADFIEPMTEAQYRLFTYKMLSDNLDAIVKRHGEKVPLPFGLTPSQVRHAKSHIDAASGKDEVVTNAMNEARAMFAEAREAYSKNLSKLGIDTRYVYKLGDAYIHHMILDYMEAGRRIMRTPRSLRKRAFQHKFKGSQRAFSLSWPKAQVAVIAQMNADAQTAVGLKEIQDNEDRSGEVRALAEQMESSFQEALEVWMRENPGYAPLNMDLTGPFALNKSTVDRLALALVGETFENVIPDFQFELARSSQNTWVVRQEVADSFYRTAELAARDSINRAGIVRRLQGGWKRYVLLAPWRWPKYLFRNIVGDTLKTWEGNPDGLKHLTQAAGEIRAYMRGEDPSPMMQGWIDQGGIDTSRWEQNIQELHTDKLRNIERKGELIPALTQVVTNPIEAGFKYWGRPIRNTTQMMESINRYANYISYLTRMESGAWDAMPDSVEKYAASIPEEINALSTNEKKAFWLSNELVGAYDMVSEQGQWLRATSVPFWAFSELNVRSHWRMLKNATRAGDTSYTALKEAFPEMAKIWIKTSPRIALKLTGLTLRVAAFGAILEAWNNSGDREEMEKELPREVRDRAHVILFRDPISGRIIYFDRLGVFQEMVDFIGVEEFGPKVKDYLNNRITLEMLMNHIVYDYANHAYNMVGPLPFKAPLELAAGQTGFPKVFPRPRRKNRAEILFDQISMPAVYRKLWSKPGPKFWSTEFLSSPFLYSAEPGRGAWIDMKQEAKYFLQKIDEYSEGYGYSERGEALREWREARKYDREELEQAALNRYLTLTKGDSSGIDKSLQNLSPENFVPKKHFNAFMHYIGEEGRARMSDAMRYYHNVIIGAGSKEKPKPIGSGSDSTEDKMIRMKERNN